MGGTSKGRKEHQTLATRWSQVPLLTPISCWWGVIVSPGPILPPITLSKLVAGVWCQYHGVVLLPPDWSLWLCFLSCAAAKVRVIIAKQSIILILLLGTSCATLQFCALTPVISFGFKRLKEVEMLSNGREQGISDINYGLNRKGYSSKIRPGLNSFSLSCICSTYPGCMKSHDIP